MAEMFCNALFNSNIGNWDVYNVTNMWGMFSQSIFNKDISKWNINPMTDIDNIFDDCDINN